MTQSNPTEELRERLLDHFTEGAPSYRVANEPQKALAELKTERILPIITQYRNATLDRLEKKAGWYSQHFSQEARKNNIEDTLIPLSALDQERRK